tara:strand:+ start:13081 stop:14811 length:1731 start_codon:yes stop_codon:yes gene_type:complete
MWLRLKVTLRDLPKWQIAVLVMWVGFIFLTIFGPMIAPYSTIEADPTSRLLPPSGDHWFGTDENGIDIFSRVLACPRTDIVIAVAATFLSVFLGSPLGVVVGLYESRKGAISTAGADIFMRLLEVIQSFPVFVFAMVLVAIFSGSLVNIIIAIAFVNMPVFVRLVRSEVLSLVQRPFAEAARAVGNTEMRTGFKHILPNATPTVVVQVSVTVGFAILLTAGLSFVGAGVKPPTPELGAMIASGSKYLIIGQWWPALFPGVTLGLIVFSFGIVGEIVNKVLDPRVVRDGSDRRRVLSVQKTSGKESSVDMPMKVMTTNKSPILEVKNVCVSAGEGDDQGILNDVSFSIGPGESLAIVGESGAGKTILLKSVLKLLPFPLEINSGSVHFESSDLLAMDRNQIRPMRIRQISAILPNAKSQLHPLVNVGDMIVGALQAHEKIKKKQAQKRAVELLTMVGITDPESRLAAYPHELSGGMAQRICLAISLMYQPKILVADEPTAGLDVTIQRQVLDLTKDLAKEFNTARLIITGDLGIAAHYCDRVAVMQAGKIVEANYTDKLFKNPVHPHTKQLLGSVQS